MEPIGYGISLLFNRYQHPFGHTSGVSEIILTDPIYRLVAGAPRQNPPVISPRGDIPKNRCPRWDSNPEPCAIQHKASQDGTTRPSPRTNMIGTAM
jgi:hypothetical protein